MLASGSERRVKLLKSLGVSFRQVVPDVDETPKPGESAEACASRLARAKAHAAATAGPGLYLAADTLVCLDGEIVGKPRDLDHAAQILRRLSGRRHRVVTADTLLEKPSGRERETVEVSEVEIRVLSEEQIRAYVATGEAMGKAGAYAIQERGDRFVKRIDGSYTNVVGLPIERVTPMLAEFGVLTNDAGSR